MNEASTLQTLASAALAASGSAPPLRAGQMVAATVQALLKDGLVRLALPQGTVDVTPPAPLAQGATVRLEVVKAPPELVLRLVDPPAVPQARIPTATTPLPPAPPSTASAPVANVLPRPMPVSYPAGASVPSAPVEGRIVSQEAGGLVRIATPQGEVAVVLRAPVPLGAPVRLDPPRGGTAPALTVLPPTPSASAGPGRPTVTPPVSTARVMADVAPLSLSTAGAAPPTSAPPAAAAAPSAAATSPSAGVVSAPSVPPSPQGLVPATPAALLAVTEDAASVPARLAASPLPAFATGSSGRAMPPEATLPQALRATLLPALQGGIGRQQGLAPLMANLDAAVSRGEAALPPAVTAAANRVLAARLPLDRVVMPEDIARAVAASGVLYEARLAQGSPPTSVAGDLKGALLMLRNVLQSFVGSDIPATSGQGAETPAPPLRGDPPSAQRPATATIAADAAPEEIGRTLLHQTEGALARTRLMQIASLPDEGAPGRPAPPAALHMEIPVVLGQQTAVAQFAVEHDGHQGPGEAGNASWRIRFALDIEPMGPVHALVTLRGGAAAVTLWAERETTADSLTAASGDLRVALDGADFAVDDVVVRRGAPPRPTHEPGGFMDRRT